MLRILAKSEICTTLSNVYCTLYSTCLLFTPLLERYSQCSVSKWLKLLNKFRIQCFYTDFVMRENIEINDS